MSFTVILYKGPQDQLTVRTGPRHILFVEGQDQLICPGSTTYCKQLIDHLLCWDLLIVEGQVLYMVYLDKLMPDLDR